MLNRRISNALVLIAFVSLFSGCAKWEDVSWDVGVSLPLLKTRIDIHDIIPDTFLAGDCHNWAYVDLNQKVYELSQDTLFNLSQAITSLGFHIPITITLQPGQAFVSSNEETVFNFQGAEVRKIRIDKGLIRLRLTNPLQEPVVCYYSLPGSSRNGSPFEATVTIPAATSVGKGVIEFFENISGYEIDLTGLSGYAYNTIGVRIDAIVDPTANPVQITPFDTLTIEADFQSLTIEEAYGYFGQHSISSGSQSVNLKIFDFFTDGTLQVDSVEASMMVSNGTGMDLRVVMKDIAVRNSIKGQTINITDPFMNLPVNIGRASMNQTTGAITPVEYEFRFDPATVKSMIELLPDKLEYEIDIEINPLGNVSLGNDFIKNTSPLSAWLELRMPIAFAATGLTMSREVGFRYESEEIRDGNLYLIADNSFPFDAAFSLTMMDINGNVIDSLTPAGIVEAGNLILPDLLKPVRTVLVIPCDQVRMGKIRQTRSMIIEVVLDTKPAGSIVRLKNDYNLEVTVSANVNTTFNP